MNDYELAFIHGVIRYPESATSSATASPPPEHAGDKMEMDIEEKQEEEKEGDEESSSKNQVPSLDVVSLQHRWKPHPSIVVGDCKLTELKRLLQLESISADFEKGSLIVGDQREIRIQKVLASCGVFFFFCNDRHGC